MGVLLVPSLLQGRHFLFGSLVSLLLQGRLLYAPNQSYSSFSMAFEAIFPYLSPSFSMGPTLWPDICMYVYMFTYKTHNRVLSPIT